MPSRLIPGWPPELYDWVQAEAAARGVGFDEFVIDTVQMRRDEQDRMQAELDANPELQAKLAASMASGTARRDRPRRRRAEE